VLAASYFRHGYKLGYFPEARFHHYYTGSLGEATRVHPRLRRRRDQLFQ
jgi:hypothetical protein